MMTGKIRHYNWNDILRLIWADAGLHSDEEARALGELWYVGKFVEPSNIRDTVIKVEVFDKPYAERLRQHVEG